MLNQKYHIALVRSGGDSLLDSKDTLSKEKYNAPEGVHVHFIKSSIVEKHQNNYLSNSKPLESGVLYQAGNLQDLEKGEFFSSSMNENDRQKYLGGQNVFGVASRCKDVDGHQTTCDEAIIVGGIAFKGDYYGKASKFGDENNYSFVQVADLSNAESIESITNCANITDLVEQFEKNSNIKPGQTFVATFQAELGSQSTGRNVRPTDENGKRHEILKTMWQGWNKTPVNESEMGHLITDDNLSMKIIDGIKVLPIQKTMFVCPSTEKGEFEFRDPKDIDSTRTIQSWTRNILNNEHNAAMLLK